MWNLDEKKLQEMHDGFLNFQEVWTLEKVKNMTLEEYTNIKKDNPNRDDFTFWIESKLDNLGSIWGGSAFKFGIYKRNDESQKESSNGRLYSQNYAWIAKYGNNENEAFNNIKEKIIQIIQASQDNNLEAIEKIDFGDAIKWKIAFHYQDVENIKIINIFSKNVLDLVSLNEFKEKLKIYQIHKKLLENKNLSLVKMIENIAIPLWNKYGMDSQNYIDKMKNLFSEYLNKKKLDKNTINKYIQVIENISKEFLKENLYSCDLFSFDQNINKLNKNEEFKLKNSNGHNMYSSALNCYRVFLIDYYEQDIFITERVQSEESNMKIIPLNQILYGPPGTGKTYHTIDKALEILGENLESRDEKKAKFDEYVKNGQIVFTTFHQSYGYEEFVEGIKPRIDSEENSKEIKYEIKDGIFKELCQKALENYKASLLTQEEFAKNEDLENKIEIFLDELVDQQKFIEKTQSGGFRLEEYNEKYRIITDDTNANLYLNLEIFKTLLENKDKIINGRSIRQILNNKHRRQIDSYYFQLVKLFKKREQNYKIDNNSSKKPDLKFYIIIIDEINRGNISKIFGELITLIEPSKRIGEPEELRVTLPYSRNDFYDKKGFGVPKNVYIIGTMNTADRSITSLDTALRRRFEFIEMMPDVEELEKSKYKDVNLKKLLKAINTRIEYLLDREKTIGHAFFVSVENLESLKKVFKNKIIPLLQEYFYNDYALIDAVLNKNGMLEISVENKDYLKNMTEFIESDKVVYKFSDSNNWSKDTFIKIYE
ncbi:TPA: McrB family protein [Campylobacter jejuni]|uniref:McrB family protein n=1 Tax=Campylobacter jejuni TaxID=197 RepID=UPI00069B8F39|nr:McrB family protein [Campylobacter jejuni]EAK3633761.1 McrB family protein [Campylobacter jejuni]EGN5848394.1 McrB family protein [Campylobacter jejuni]EKG4139387.1 McrB family protein [Campylobacter jejuni]RTI87491.1 endonuclease [Campylobacter jejuni]HEC2379269.1 McrB family protein [Campylobacter jejuni]